MPHHQNVTVSNRPSIITTCAGLCILVLNIFTWGLAATKLKNVKKDADSAIVKAEATGTAVVVGGQQSTISGAPPAAATPLTVHQRYEARFRSFGIPPRISSSLATCVDVGSNILNPPVAAAAAGMLIGLIPPLRSLFFATKPLGLIETAPTAAVSLSASIDASVANGPSQPSDIPLVSALLPINPATVAAGLSRCTAGMSSGGASSQSASAASQQLLSLFRNGSGWYACTQAAGAAFSAATCCVPLLERTDVFASASTGTIMSASGNTTAAAVNNVLSFGGIYQSLAVASVAAQSIVPPPVPTAPFGPTLTSALQAFASAIVPVVAITLGSNIVAAAPKAPPNLKAKTDPEATNATKALSSVAVVGVLPTSDSSSSICTTVTATSDANAIDDNNKGDCPAVGVDVSMDTSASDIKEIKTPSSKLDYAAAQARKGLKLFIDIVTGLDVTTGEQVIRGRVIAAVAMVRMLIIPILGIVSVYIGSQVGIIPPDRTLQFVLLVEASTPTAMNLQLISDVMGTGSRAMARLIAVTYVASVVTMTIHISIALALIRSGFFNS